MRLRVACDSLVALGGATADGATLFAKNSDRPAAECQPLVQLPGAALRPGRRACAAPYIEIPQVAETARVIGSRPYWCWGFEHGLNEHGVAIGNHTVFTKDALGAPGLIGMDLVRLGLERARSAAQAAEVITALVEAHGQGGSGYADKDWPYHNSFLIADRREAYRLETSDRRWAVRRVARRRQRQQPPRHRRRLGRARRRHHRARHRAGLVGGGRATGASTSPPRTATPASRPRSSRAGATGAPASCSPPAAAR